VEEGIQSLSKYKNDSNVAFILAHKPSLNSPNLSLIYRNLGELKLNQIKIMREIYSIDGYPIKVAKEWLSHQNIFFNYHNLNLI